MLSIDPSVIVEIVDYLEQHPQVLRLSSYFDCKLILYNAMTLMTVLLVFFFEAAMNVVRY